MAKSKKETILMSKSYEAILLAAGKGERLGSTHNKVLLPLGKDKRPLFDYALRVFLEDECCSRVIMTIRQSDEPYIKQVLTHLYQEIPSKVYFIEGGKERQYSVEKGLEEVTDRQKGYVMVHDAARPFIHQEMVQSLFKQAQQTKAAVVAIPAKDTMKRVKSGEVVDTFYRPEVWQVQTPQAFQVDVLQEAHNKAKAENYLANEEGELVERLGHVVSVVLGSAFNFKVTTPEDLELAEGYLLRKEYTHCNESENEVR